MTDHLGQNVSPRRTLGLSRRQIADALDALVDHGFAGRWERHSNLRYWRVVNDHIPGVKPYSTPWYSQTQISAWIDGCRAMGAAMTDSRLMAEVNRRAKVAA